MNTSKHQKSLDDVSHKTRFASDEAQSVARTVATESRHDELSSSAYEKSYDEFGVKTIISVRART